MSETNENKVHYLVVSNMRTGSSAVARVMHEKMGIKMFYQQAKADEFNPDGYYEDVGITNINEHYIRGSIDVFDLIKGINRYIHIMEDMNVPWGLKDGRIAILSPMYKHVLPNARIIRVYRNGSDIIRSQIRKYGFTEEHIKRRIFMTNISIDAVWGDNIWASLNMTERRTDEEIENTIRERIRE